MFDPRLEVSKVEESLRCPMSSGSTYLAYPCSGYQIESGYLSPFMLNRGQALKGNGFSNIFSEELIISNLVLKFVLILENWY